MRNIVDYKVFERAPEFQDELNVVLKCPDCGHVFSPGPTMAELMGIGNV